MTNSDLFCVSPNLFQGISMKRLISLVALSAALSLSGCATNGPVVPQPQAGGVLPPNSVYSDPTYPGPGVYFGGGLGRWGGQSGAGVGFGLGF